MRVIAGYAVGALRKGFEKLREPEKTQHLWAAARASAEDSGQIAGKRVLITGSTRGIGRALADGFAAAGASVAIHGRSESDASTAAGAIRKAHSPSGALAAIAGDLASVGAGKALVDRAIQALGGLDIVINNAAIHDPRRKPIWATSTEEMLEVLKVNVLAPFDVSAAAIANMLESGVAGRIINMSSDVADPKHVADTGIASYGVSKVALEGLSRYLAAEAKQLTVTTLRPTTIATDMVVPLFTADQRWKLPAPESIVPAVLYLATAPHSEVHGRVFEQKVLTEQLSKKLL